MPREGWKKLPRIEMVPIPEDVHVPKDIPASKVRIPLTYTGWEVEYENESDNNVSEDETTHLSFKGVDRRSDIVVGPVKPRGMIKLNLYLNDEEIPVVKEKHLTVKVRYLQKNTPL